MRKKGPLVALVMLGIGVSIWIWHKKAGDAKVINQTRQIIHVSSGTIEDAVEATGEVMPLNRVEIKPPIGGRVEKLFVEEGNRVKAGQILGWMSSTDRAAILDAARSKGLDEVKKWEDAYQPTPIIAPLSGSIILKNVVVGQTVDATTVLYAMSDKLIVLADVDETDIGRVKIGMPTVITLDAYPDKPIDGRVFQILYEGKNVSNVITYGAKIEPMNVPPFFRSQMTANIRMITNKKENVILLPSSAITTLAGGERHVMIPGPDGKPLTHAIQTGLENGDQVEVTEGLQEGDAVIVGGKRYSPQKAASSSPLIMGGPKSANQQGQGSRKR